MLHVASGDLWAGAEVQLFTLLKQLRNSPGVEPQVALMNDGELARQLRAHDVPVSIFDESRLSVARIAGDLRMLMKEFRPTVVHTHRQKENVLGAWMNWITNQSACVRTSHGAPEHAPRGLKRLHKRLFFAMDEFCGRYLQQRVIAVSQALGADLATLFGSDRVVVIENGIDIEALASATDITEFRRREPAAIHIGIVGRLEKVKRVDLFLEMAQMLARAEPTRPWRFHVIGDGSQRQSLQTLCASLELESCVTFHGHRSDSAACLRSLDALVMCSDHEGMPMTPLEAIACGTPVVAHDVGGLRDILEANTGGLLNNRHTAEGYAAAVRQLLGSDVQDLVERGRARVTARFSARANADKVLALYRTLTSRRNQPGDNRL